ncbi:MAG: nitroreductase/quinone reductase family protein [Acidimicrobiia bacterium]
MPLPMWVAQVNKRMFNPRELKKGKRPVLTHVGRLSGNTHRTPLDAHPVEGGYMFIVMYGPTSDWVSNVLASGDARLSVDGNEFSLVSPRMVPKEAALALMSVDTKTPADFLNVTDYLQMDIQLS